MKKISLILAAALTAHTAQADEAQKLAEDFTNLYLNTCVAYLGEFDELRQKLAEMPQLSEKEAETLLGGLKGGAWLIPHEPENHVIAVASVTNYCAVFARHTDIAAAEKAYLDFVNKPPQGFTVLKREDKRSQNNTVHDLSYQWQHKETPRRPSFSLTTSTDAEAPVQAMFSAAITKD